MLDAGWIKKNAANNMANVGKPCKVDDHDNYPALFMTTLCPRLGVHVLWLYSCLVDQSEHCIHPGDITLHTGDTTHTDKVKCWALHVHNNRQSVCVEVVSKGPTWYMKQNAIGRPLVRGPHLSFPFWRPLVWAGPPCGPLSRSGLTR